MSESVYGPMDTLGPESHSISSPRAFGSVELKKTAVQEMFFEVFSIFSSVAILFAILGG